MTRPKQRRHTLRPRGRGALRGAALALTLALATPWLGGCATNPATGGQMLSFMSLDEEKQLGKQEHPKLVAAFGGEVTDPQLTSYIDEIGQRLAKTSELPDLKFSFTIIDSNMINAFALPGGYVHVTRGLMALANSEAELAGVLAHEIGHVTARHSAQRHSQGVLAGIGVNVLGILTGSPQLANLAGTGAELYLKSYSRDHEFEADTLGIRYLKRAGYAPDAMAQFLTSLRASSQLDAKLQGLPAGAVDETNLMATHPRTVDRVQRAAEAAGGPPVADPRVGRDIYLQKLAGMIYGDSPEQGFARGREFRHPKLRFRFQVPEGFELINTPQRVQAKGPGGAVIIFDGAEQQGRRGMVDYLVNVWGKGVRIDNREEITVNGMPAATGTTRQRTQAGVRDFRLLAIHGDGNQVWRFLFVTPTDRTQGLATAFRETTHSFKKVSAAEAATWHPLRIRLHKVTAGDTVQSLAARLPFEKLKVDHFRVLNGLDAGETLKLGETVKLVVEAPR